MGVYYSVVLNAGRFQKCGGSRADLPSIGKIVQGEDALLVATFWDVEKNQRRVDKGVFGIELGAERARIVPESGIGNFYRARGIDVPGELVEFGDFDFLVVGEGFDLLDVTAEVADLVKGVPRGHLEIHFAVDIGDFHRDAKEVLLWMGQRDGVVDCGGGWGGD